MPRDDVTNFLSSLLAICRDFVQDVTGRAHDGLLLVLLQNLEERLYFSRGTAGNDRVEHNFRGDRARHAAALYL